jgi:hypothetical protein
MTANTVPAPITDGARDPHLVPSVRRPLSEELWGLRWSDHLPLDLGGGASVHPTTFARAVPFIRAHYATIFEDDGTSPFKSDLLTEQKARYYELCADFFEFTHEGSSIGLLVCDPSDWSTYYVRSAAILPDHHGRQLVQKFFTRLAFPELTRVGVERVEIDVAPSNLAMRLIAARLRFVASGTVLTDRWGAHSRFTRFLAGSTERIFAKQFCAHAPRTAAQGCTHERRQP